MRTALRFTPEAASSFAVLFALAGAPAVGQTRSMVVHLPEAPIESMGQLAEGVTQLAGYIQSAVPGVALDVKAYRNSEDATRFVTAGGDSVAVVLCDPSFLLDLPEGFEARHRFVRRGRQTGRRIVVVKTGSGLESLSDLRGRSLTVSVANGAGGARYLSQAVFGNEVDLDGWFGSIVHETDDFTSVAAVLYDRADAALVSADNPLVQKHLGKELIEIYATAPLSLSVIAVRRDAFSASQLGALDRALGLLATDDAGGPIRSVLKIEGLGRIAEPASFVANLLGPTSGRRELEIALPTLAPAGVESLPPLPAGAVPFGVGVELAEVPIPRELVDAVLEGESAGGERAGREP